MVNAIKTFEKHPSILKIKELNSGCRFSFENASHEDAKNVTRELDISKASHFLDIPIKIIKQNTGIFSEFFFVNHSINNSTFPFQFSRRTHYDRCLYKQLYDYFDVIFSRNVGFEKILLL